MSIGSLFSGYGGLDMGIQEAIGDDVAWFVEFDEAPSKILAHHWPHVPNYGDITTVDWASVPRVDVLCGGFPCQDVSLAGLRRGLRAGTRSGLWSEFAKAIDVLRPALVVIENVRGLLSAEASGAMEPDPWDLGNGPDEPALRALGAVLGDLADLGYDAEWCGIRAADAGAPHGRFRVFVVAHPAGVGRAEAEPDVQSGQPDVEGRTAGSTHTSGIARSVDHGDDSASASHPEDKRHERSRTTRDWRPGPADRRDPAAIASSIRLEPGDDRVTGSTEARAGRLRESAGDHRSALAPDASGRGRDGRPQGAERNAVERATAAWSGGAAWGSYQPAVERWEFVTGRVAPAPTRPDGRDGGERLSPVFVEWMMGLPEGHVTGAPITRTEQLKALGNGVVPQQAALALSLLLNHALPNSEEHRA